MCIVNLTLFLLKLILFLFCQEERLNPAPAPDTNPSTDAESAVTTSACSAVVSETDPVQSKPSQDKSTTNLSIIDIKPQALFPHAPISPKASISTLELPLSPSALPSTPIALSTAFSTPLSTASALTATKVSSSTVLEAEASLTGTTASCSGSRTPSTCSADCAPIESVEENPTQGDEEVKI